ncbi:MAG TPA: hypothetical protein VFZ23_06125 [Pyrinomonadaceae bacterium]
MNDEYLWQITGQDPEIAKLEETLAVFRYRESSPPALRGEEAKQPVQRGFSLAFGFAFASVAIIVMITAVLWFRMPGASGADEVTFVYVPAEEVQPPANLEHEIAPPSQPMPRPPVRPRSAKNYTVAALKVRRKKIDRSSTAALTKEERYAYQQLMLALSISSSKLKIVQNAINGVEDADNSPLQNNR